MSRFEDIVVDVDGAKYGGQFATQGDEVIVFYAGALCARHRYSNDVPALPIAREALRIEVKRRLETSLQHMVAEQPAA